MASSSSTKVTLKLLIDTKNEKVLFAEASKAVIDILFNTLRLPYGTIVRLLSRNNMGGSIGNLYHSVENLSENRMQPDPIQNNDVFLNPGGASISSTEIYGLPHTNEVKDNVTFLVMDDLFIQPMSAISIITLLNKLDFKEVGTLQEKVVELGLVEVGFRAMSCITAFAFL